MASFNGNIGTPSGGFNLKVEYSINQSITGNYSDVTATGYVKRNNSSYHPYNSSSSASLTINATSKSYTGSYDLRSDGYKEITSNTVRVYHNDDGTKSITISFSFNGKLSSYYPNGSISQTITLPTIPRASTVACSSPFIGDTAIITINKKVSSFTHNVTYHILDYDTLTGTIAENTSETVLTFDTSTLKEQIYALIPNAKSISATIRCRTYSGSTKIGDTQVANFNLYAKEEDCKPIVTGEVVDTNPYTINLTGGEGYIIVKNASKPKVTITATPQLSSTIKNYSINLNDGQTASEQEYTFDTINSNKITVNSIDSRDYSNPCDIDLTDRIVDYVKLHFNSIELPRPEGTSNEIILNCDGVWFNGNFKEDTPNTLKINFQYRLSGETEWIDGGEITPTIEGNKFSFNNYSLGNLFDYNSEYQFKIIATDLLMTVGDTNKETIPVPKGQEVWYECEDGIGVYGHIWLNDKDVPISKNEKNDSLIDTYSCDFLNGEIIYNNENGSNESIILNKTVKDASSILIEYKCNSYGYKTIEIINPNKKNIILDYLVAANDTIVQSASSKWYINEENVSLINSCMINHSTSSGVVTEQGNKLIYITKIIKYKY